MPVTTLTLVRHSEGAGNVARERAEAGRAEAGRAEVVAIGPRDADVELTDPGVEQARAVGTWLAERGAGRSSRLPGARAGRRAAARAHQARGLTGWWPPGTGIRALPGP